MKLKQMKIEIDEAKHQAFKQICKNRKVPYAKILRSFIDKYIEYERSKE